jgi:DNA-binding NtrC family response regulator
MAARCFWTKSPISRRPLQGEAAADARDRRVRTRGILEEPARGCARLLRHQRRPAHEAVDEGRFRQDLLFRLNTIELRLPPLRDRREDIAAAGRALPAAARRALSQAIDLFDEGAMKALLAHTWPGNVRELDHAVERAVLMAQGDDDSRRRPGPARRARGFARAWRR